MERHKKIDALIEAEDVQGVRGIILDLIISKAGKTRTLDTVRYAMEKSPGLFEEDNGNIEIRGKETWTQPYVRDLYHALEENFSRKKLLSFVDAGSALALDPAAYKEASAAEAARREAETDALFADSKDSDENVIICDENVIIYEDYPAGREEANLSKKGNPGNVFGIILMVLGVAAAVVALCVPHILFLLGIGIGVFMIGSSVVYLGMSHAGSLA